MRLPVVLLMIAVPLVSTAKRGVAQEPPRAEVTTPFVFLDCNAPNCDFDHFRREIAWVNWVRDRQDADVHLLVTAERTGGGGWFYTLDYLGANGFADIEKRLEYVSDPEDTDTEVRNRLTQVAALGLIQFVERSDVLPRLLVEYEAPTEAIVQRDDRDPWNLWSFRVGVSGEFDGQADESSYAIESSFSATRVDHEHKVLFRISGEYDRERYEYQADDGTIVTEVDEQEDHEADLLSVWSLSSHWSLGGRANASRSTFENRDIAVFGGPAIEYNIFPYSESTRRSLTFRYTAEAAAFDYADTTVELKTAEVLPRHSLTVSAAVQQPWGEVHGSVEAIQYLHNLRTHRINVFWSVEYRLFRGFNLDVFGRFSRIKDQFFLPAEDPSAVDVLLERIDRETDFRYGLNIGFSYRFGSQFANVVNPRMGGGRRGPGGRDFR